MEEKKYSETTIKELEGKIAEYERNLEDGELVGKEWHDEQVAILLSERNNLANYVKELKEEIERLTERENELVEDKANWINKWKEQVEYTAELQKQVDEQRHLVAIACDEFAKTKLKLEKAVKYTAKEIYTQVLEWIPVSTDKYHWFINALEEWLKDKYGLEVE